MYKKKSDLITFFILIYDIYTGTCMSLSFFVSRIEFVIGFLSDLMIVGTWIWFLGPPKFKYIYNLAALFWSMGISSDNVHGLVLAVSSSVFIGSSFIIKKKGLKKAGTTGTRAGSPSSSSSNSFYFYYPKN